MIDFTQISVWLAGALIVAGLVQYVKGIVPRAPSWVWLVVAPVAAFGAALALGGTAWLWNALGIWACGQLFYETIIKFVASKIAATAPVV